MSTTELIAANTEAFETPELDAPAGSRTDTTPPKVTNQLRTLGARLTEILSVDHRLRFTPFGTSRCETCNSPYCDLA
ncbi:hypothetical protein ASH00_15870 [Arthrobacter sp. Soil782]|uniref:hypothetical protein n=1 Tax=Arthrobacter sp. Soil782 TaxID=1736410 RepID=UPI0006FC29C3|nr:hypothetical protein [Arthrobacter sp. Soil782]KRF03262.1 hypothetical protein ASH00_15870 [Arthrobacter sp. Soil782]